MTRPTHRIARAENGGWIVIRYVDGCLARLWVAATLGELANVLRRVTDWSDGPRLVAGRDAPR